MRMRVTVRVVRTQPEYHGLAIWGDGRGLIRLTPDADTVMIDSLMEEWSHLARAECPLPILEDHDALFWAIYGKIVLRWRGET